MRLLWLLFKDLVEISRDRKTLSLILLAPVVITILAGLVFTDSSQETSMKRIPVAICQMDNGPEAEVVAQEMSKVFNANVSSNKNCLAQAEGELGNGNVLAVIAIQGGFSNDIANGSQGKLTVMTDNARPEVAGLVGSVARGIAYGASKEVSARFIGATWSSLENMSGGLDSLSKDLDNASAETAQIQASLKETREHIAAIDTVSFRASINSSRSSLSSLQEGIDSLKREMNNSVSDIDYLDARMGAIHAAAINISDGILSVRSNISRTSSNLTRMYDDAFCPEAASFQNITEAPVQRWVLLCNDLIAVNESLGELSASMAEQAVFIGQLANESNATRIRLAAIREGVVNTSAHLDSVYELGELEASIASMEKAVLQLEELKQVSTEEMDSMGGIVASLSEGILDLKTSTLSAKDVLDALTSREPDSIVTPILFEEVKRLSGIRRIESIFPALVGVILMFVTVLFSAIVLLKERSSGTLKRTMMSPVNPTELVLSKVALTVLVAIFQVVLVYLVGSLAFGLAINWHNLPQSILVAGLMSLSFASIGMIIAIFAESENTAMLASLVICLPLLFLSGIFFPRELMVSEMQAFSTLLPLTQGIKLLESLLLYSQTEVIRAGLNTFGLLFWAVLGIAASAKLLGDRVRRNL